MTSASRTDPPGCTTAVAPASARRRGRRGTGRTRPTPPPSPAARRAAFITATFTASTRLIWPAPTASVRSAAGEDHGVRLHVRADAPGEAQRRPLLGGRRPLRHDLRIVARRPRLARLDRRDPDPASARRRGTCGRPRRSPLGIGSAKRAEVRRHHAQVRLRRQHRSRLVVHRRRDDRLDERARSARGRCRRRAAGSGRRCRRTRRADPLRAPGRRPQRRVAPVATPQGLVCLMTTPAGSVNSSAIRSRRIEIEQVGVRQLLALVHLPRRPHRRSWRASQRAFWCGFSP